MTTQPAFGLDREILDFIEKTNAHYPEDAASLDAAGQRKVYNAMCRAFDVPISDEVAIYDDFIDRDESGRDGTQHPTNPVPVRCYSPPKPLSGTLVLYMHGGGFVVGGLESHHSVCAELCLASGCDLISVDYRLAPEHIHPAQFEDCLAAFHHYSSTYDRIVVVGDSAGGNLAAALCVSLQNSPDKPIGAVLIYPGLGGDQLDLPSYSQMAEAPMLTLADVHLFHALWHGGEQAKGDPISAPLCADDLSGHPPTAIFSAAIDPLRDDGDVYAGQLRDQGVIANCQVQAGLVHGYLRARRSSSKAAAGFDKICGAVRQLVETGTLPD